MSFTDGYSKVYNKGVHTYTIDAYLTNNKGKYKCFISLTDNKVT